MGGAKVLSKPEPTEGQADKFPWEATAWIGILLIVCYFPVLARLFTQWMDDPNMGHGLFVPVIAGYIAWQSRDKLMAIPPSWLGLLVVIYASVQLLIGTLGAELFLQRTAFVIAIIGSVLFFGGMRTVLVLSFPMFLLFLMVPIPGVKERIILDGTRGTPFAKLRA